MTQTIWTAVDTYFCDALIPFDPVLSDALRDSDAAGLPQHNVSPTQGKFLHLLAKLKGAQRILEIGTLGGYSTIWLARALPVGGSLVSLEANPTAAAVASALASGASLMPMLTQQRVAPFDLIFIDADKPNNPSYLEWSLKLSRPGTVIIGDNVVRNGAVADAASNDPNVLGVRRFFDLMAENPCLSATAIQTVGSKGYDGFSMAVVLA